MVDPQNWPTISEALANKLKAQWPEKCHNIKQSHDENVLYAGEVKAISRILLEYYRQKESNPI